MEKVIWSDNSPEYGQRDYGQNAVDAGGLDAARGLLIGLAISQVFWLGVAYFVF
jgi:hypothetical protein